MFFIVSVSSYWGVYVHVSYAKRAESYIVIDMNLFKTVNELTGLCTLKELGSCIMFLVLLLCKLLNCTRGYFSS
jgi:hypothetical protein